MSEASTSDGRVLVDVGIPTRERPDLVRLAIDSVLAQDLAAWRLVVSENGVGGGATEAAVAPYLKDPRIRYVATGGELGGAENWTRLIQAGDAPYVALLHDDDLWDPTFLGRRVAFLEQNPSCAFVFSGNREIDATGAVVRETEFVLPEGAYPPEVLFPILYEHNVIGPPSILVRRDAYEAVGAYFDSEFFPYWDYEMWLRLAARFPAGYLTVRDCSYRMHDVRMTFTVRRFGDAYLQAIDRADALLERVTGGRRPLEHAPPPPGARAPDDGARLLRGGRASQRRQAAAAGRCASIPGSCSTSASPPVSPRSSAAGACRVRCGGRATTSTTAGSGFTAARS